MEVDLTHTSEIITALRPYLYQERSIMVAFSGGIDSTVLLHALVQLRSDYALQLSAIYIHHGISQHADQWAQHCQQVCQQWHVPLHICKVQIDLSSNIEAQARTARYHAISQQLHPNQVLMTAQHLNDQSETFLLALKRGSGPTGLSAMPAISPFASSYLIRPLLGISRRAIEIYAGIHQLPWIEDESNQDTRYDRNFLRLKVLPEINQRWPQFNQMVARSAELCAEETQLIAELIQEQLQHCLTPEKQLYLQPLLAMSDIKRNAILRAWFKLHHVDMPSRQQLTLLWQTVALARDDANPIFTLQQKMIRRYQRTLYLLPNSPSLRDTILPWNMSSPLILPDDLGQLTLSPSIPAGLRAPRANEQVTIRFQAQGRFTIVNRLGSRTIKKLWQELGVPPWMRNRIPLLYYNETLISAVGVFTTLEGQGSDLTVIHTV
jgi:tRNA(Ile)-lysidine synthase